MTPAVLACVLVILLWWITATPRLRSDRHDTIDPT